MRWATGPVGEKLRVSAVLALVLSLLAVTEWPSMPPAGACGDFIATSTGTNVTVADCFGGIGGDSGGGGTGSGGGGSSGPICWVLYGEDRGDDQVDGSERMRELLGEDVPDDVTWWYNQCSSDCGPMGCIGGAEVINYYWTEPLDLAPGQPWEALLLPESWAVVEGSLTAPDVQQEPPAGDPAIVQVPTFVSVDDPPGVIRDTVCAPSPSGQPCVSIEAVPTLYFDPGDGSAAIECAPEGTRFDPDGPEPSVQAAPPACAHSYDQHTSDGSGYPVAVWTEWNVTWSTTGSGPEGPVSGVFDPPIQVAADGIPPRVVDEVQAVIGDVDLGENAR